MQFVNLHVHTCIGSMLDSLIKPLDLCNRCIELNQPAVGISDHGSLGGHYAAFRAGQETGLKVILGIEAYFIHNPRDPDSKKERSKHIVLLAQNEEGYRNLLRMNYESYENTRTIFGKIFPRISWHNLEKHNKGIFCLTGCVNGIIARHIQNDDPTAALRDAERLRDIFGDRLYLELQPHSLKAENIDQHKVNKSLYSLHKKTGIPMLATNDCHMLLESDFKAHDLLLAISDKKPLDDPDRRRYVNEFYLKTADHVLKYFGEELGTELCRNTLEVAERCEKPDYMEKKQQYYLPRFPIEQEEDYNKFKQWHKTNAQDVVDDKAYLRFKCIKEFKKKDFSDKRKYWDRIKTEMEVIEEKSLSSYMLIVSDYIAAARKAGCPVGPGRGSSSGSLVAYILGITEVDSIKYGLLFERFINSKREQLADIDTDFGDNDVPKQYLIKKYGQEYIASISNIIYLTPKTVVTDIARSLKIGKDKSETFRLSKIITNTIPDNTKTVEEAFETSSEFRQYMLDYPEVYTYATKLQNLPRQYGVHAAGIVISDRPLPDNIPLKINKNGIVDTQYEKDTVEECGYLKVDLLGVNNLNIIKETKRLIEVRGKDLPKNIRDFNDKKTYDLISAGDTIGVFQLEASLASLCRTLKPQSLEEISDINALGRPSCPPEEREDFINRKFGRVKPTPMHPKLKDSMKRTYYKCVYEESLMELAQKICNWDLQKADVMRRICKGKKKTAHLLAKIKKEFIRDAFINGVLEKDAEKLFETVNYFSSYGFNLSHSISYSMLSYETAYYKAHFPTEFFCALLNSVDPNKMDKIKVYQTEVRNKGIKLLPPDINKSPKDYTIEASNKIRMGLGSIKGVGEKAIVSIIENRPYENMVESVKKTNHSKINIGVVRSLIDAGCFDGLKISRKILSENYEKFREKFQAAEKKERTKIFKEIKKQKPDMTKEEAKEMKKNIIIDEVEFNYEFPGNEEWDLREKLERERMVLGDYMSGSVDDVYGDFFVKDPRTTTFDMLEDAIDGAVVRVEGLIRRKVREFKVKNGKNKGRPFGKYQVEDLKKNLAEMTVFTRQYKELKDVLVNNTPIICTCMVSSFAGKKSLALRNIVKI